MKHPKHHIPLLIFSITILLLVSSLYLYMFNATFSSMNKAEEARNLVSSEQIGQSQAKTLATLARTTAPQRMALTSYFVPADNIIKFITDIESLGTKTGSTVTLGSIDADPLTNATIGTVGNINARVNVEGSWTSIMKVLALIERMPFAASISHVNLSNAGNIVGNKGTNQTLWNLSFDVRAQEIVQDSTQ